MSFNNSGRADNRTSTLQMVDLDVSENVNRNRAMLPPKRRYVAPPSKPQFMDSNVHEQKEFQRGLSSTKREKHSERISTYTQFVDEQKRVREQEKRLRKESRRNNVSIPESKAEPVEEKQSNGALRRNAAIQERENKREQTRLYRAARQDERVAKNVAKIARRTHKEKIQTESLVIDGVQTILEILNPYGNHPEIVDLFGPYANYVYQLYRSRTIADVWSANYSLRLAYPELPETVARFTDESVKRVFEALASIRAVVRVESFSDNLEEFRFWLTRFLSGDVVATLRSIALTIFSFKLFDKDLTFEVFRYLGKPSKMTILEMLSGLYDSVVKLIRVGEKLFSGQSYSEVLFADSPPQALLSKLRALTYYTDKIYTGLPVEGAMDAYDFVHQANELIADSDLILKNLSPFSEDKSSITKMRDILRTAVFNTTVMLQGNVRPVPYAVLLHGDPGIGKAMLLSFVADIWSGVKGRTFEPRHIYHRVMTSQYWEGYQPMSHRIVHYSEVGNAREELVRAKGDPAIMEITSLIDNNPYVVDMAFDGKGKNYAMPDLVIADTNSPDLNLKVLVKNWSAYQRRFLYIEPRVKSAFCKDGSTSLDSQKCFDSDLPEMDRWTFSVYYYVPKGPKDSFRVTLMDSTNSNDDIYKLVSVLKQLFVEHIITQEKIVNDAPSMYNSSLYEVKSAGNGVNELNAALYESKEQEPILVQSERIRSSVYPYVEWTYTVSKLSMKVAFYYVAFLLLSLAFIREKAGLVLKFYVASKLTGHKINWRRYVYGDFTDEMSVEGRNLLIRIAAIGTALGLLCLYFRKKSQRQDIGVEAKLYDVRPEQQIELDAMEKAIGSMPHTQRIPVRNSAVWNVREVSHPEGVHRGDKESLDASVRRNLRSCFVDSDSRRRTILLGVQGSYALINTHALGKGDARIRVAGTGSVNETSVFFDTILTPQNRRDLGNDVSMVCLSGVSFRDILKHFGDVLPERLQYTAIFNGVTCIASFIRDPAPMHNGTERIQVPYLWHYNYLDHYTGLCGTPLIVDSVGVVIAGIHAGGAGKSSYAVPVLKGDLETAIASFKGLMPVSSRPIETQACEEPGLKSPFRYEVLHGLNYQGKLPGVIMINKKSRLVRSPMSSVVADIEVETGLLLQKRFAPPLMMPRGSGDTYVSPYNLALRKISRQRPALNGAILSVVVERYVSFILAGIGETKLAPLTLSEAINGVVDDPFTKRINVSTGAGFPFKGKKRDYLPLVEEGGTIRQTNEELGGRVAAMFHNYASGRASGPVYTGCLKDEPRLLEKVAAGKTRLFFISPLDALVVSRMVLAPFYTMMVEKSYAFCTAVGINMHSGADEFVRQLNEFSPLLLEGDYGAFDQCMPYDIGHAAATVVYKVLEACGYNDEALQIVRGVLTDLLFPMLEINKDLFEAPAMQPSGKYATAEDNSLRGVIMLMYYWYSHPELRELDFFSHVLPRTYGDDLLAAVKPSVSEAFNNVTYGEFCTNVYNIEYTSARKDEALRPFMDIDSCSFLKRNFRWHAGFERWIAPLDIDSLYKALMWYIPSSSVPRAEQLHSTCVSMMWELVLHVNEKSHWTIREKVEEELAKVVGFHQKLPNFEEIVTSMFDAPDIAVGSARKYSLDPEIVNCDNTTIESLSMLGVGQEHIVCQSGVGELVTTSCCPEFVKCCNKMNYFYENPQPHLTIGEQLAFYEEQLDQMHALADEYKSSASTFSNRYLRNSVLRSDNMEYVRMCERERMLRSRIRDLELTIYAVKLILLHEQEITMESAVVDTENIVDVAGQDVDYATAGEPMPFDEGQVNSLDMGSFLSRPVLVFKSVMGLSTDANFRLSVWDLFTKEPSVRAKLRNFAYLSGNLMVRVTISGSPFHYGKMLISYQPYAPYNENILNLVASSATMRNQLLCYLSQAPGATTMDIKANQPLDVECPFISPKPMFRLYNNTTTVISNVTSYQDMVNAGDLFLYSINQPKSASASGTPVYIQVYAWMDNAQLGTNTATQVEITTESEVLPLPAKVQTPVPDEREVGPVQAFSSSAQKVSDMIASADIPVLSMYAKASSMVFGALQGVASIFGWSRPVPISEPVIMKLEPFQNGALTIGFDTAQRIVLDPKQELTVDPRVVAEQEDTMAISHICGVPSLINTVSWSTATPIMSSPFYIANITPSLARSSIVSLTNYVLPSAMSFAAAPFVYWRGDVTFRFEIVCSAFHRGKIAVVYEPNNAQMALINASFDYNKQYIRIVDIQETQTFEVTVKWANYRSWLQVSNTADGAGNQGSSVSQLGVGYANGYIALTAFTELQSPDGSAASVNVYAYSKNMRFNQLSATNLPTTRTSPVVGFAAFEEEEKIFVQSEIISVADKPVFLEMNQSTATEDHIAELYFGEQPTSFRGLLKRYVTNQVISIPAHAANTNFRLAVRNTIMPENTYPYNASAGTGRANLYSYLKYAYLGLRGGVRKRYHLTPTVGTTGTMQVRVSRYTYSSGSSATATTSDAGIAASTLDGSVMFVPDTVGGVEVEFPFYTNNLFFFSFYDDFTPGGSTDEMNNFYTRDYLLEAECSGTTIAGNLVVDVATAEDFSFLRFSGAPMYSY